MALLFRLPLMLLELLLRRLFDRGDDVTASVVTPEAAAAAATPAPMPTPTRAPAFTGGTSVNGAPPPTADEAIERRVAREAAEAVVPEPEPTPLRPIAAEDHVDREAEVVESFGPADDVGGTIVVEVPWPGYDRDTASAITQRLRSADAATKAVVTLYERGHKNRATVLRAAG
jgi:hypothetical protein